MFTFLGFRSLGVFEFGGLGLEGVPGLRLLLHNIMLNHNKKIVVVEGQTEVKTDEDGRLIYNQYHNIEEEVQKLTEDWLSKNSLPRLCAADRKG